MWWVMVGILGGNFFLGCGVGIFLKVWMVEWFLVLVLLNMCLWLKVKMMFLVVSLLLLWNLMFWWSFNLMV